MAMTEHTITVNGLPVHYLEAGAQHGRTIMLLHGGIGTAATNWQPAMTMLADEFHLYAPDLPGFGQTAPIPAESVQGLVDWLQTFMRTIGVEQAVMVGNSFGGLLARLTGANFPQITPAVILVNGGTIPEVPALLKTLSRIPGLSNLTYTLLGRMATGRGTLERLIHVKSVLTPQFRSAAAANAPGFARFMKLTTAGIPEKIDPLVPTLILWGVSDGFTSVDEAKTMKGQIPGAKLVEIEDCGHVPQLETVEVFAFQVSQFLSKLGRQQSGGVGILPTRD